MDETWKPENSNSFLKLRNMNTTATPVEAIFNRGESTVKYPDLSNELPLEKPKKRDRTNIIKDYLVDYTANSNLHGLKYIGEKERTYVEKIFWLFMFTCCVVLCAGLIRKVWIKWNESPVIVSFAENPTPVWQIPYPAVTVCFETKAMQRKFNFTEYYHLYLNDRENLTEHERDLFEDISMVCDDHLAPSNGRRFSSGVDTVNNIKSVSPNLTEVFFGCKWKDIPSENCSDLFSPVLTEEGLCYTFNTLGPEEMFRLNNLHRDYPYLEHDKTAESWSLEEGYASGTPIETYPHRGAGYGVKSGLTFLLKAKRIDLDYLCRGPVQGFKILLHNPAELPRLSQQYFRSPLSQEVVVAVKPKMMTTSYGLRPYEPTRRQCYFPSERYLQYFKVYTQANCEMECLSNFTYTRCGCVHFGMPYGPNMEVCNAGSRECIKAAQMELVTISIQSGLDGHASNDTDNLGEALKVSSKCQCLPACTSIEYEAETSQADYDWAAIFRAYRLVNVSEELKDLTYSRVMVFFKEAQFITSRRSELYGQTDFLANCGGLLGLFMGFSILSVAEIVYFLTLRLCCLLWRRRNKKRRIDFTTNDNIPGPSPNKVMHPYND
ncbi:pickpocket protein 28-like isoform X2 [Trichoplusia ni]|uniref:Pickpocket protein 28-like isoform X2 n=1 Tax=Trichoplusia ni TaxID=7111 RepID=A0A7E5VBI6_TRINI|nr:pickpocket protein 28-like isoform X2 [Trichoplusia ni]